MAKLSYEIPTSLDASFLDSEIAVKSREGLGFQAVPLRVILSILASALGLMLVLFRSFIGQGGAGLVLLFALAWALMTMLLVKYDKSRRMGIQLLMPLLSYTKANRRVATRRTDDAAAFYSILGIDEVAEDGLINFTDGGFGYCYRVVGTASILLFDSDKNAILDRIDSYYRKLDIDVGHMFVTAKEPQRIHNQLVALKRRYERLKTKDPDLVRLVAEQEETLTDYVGGRFRTIHQYLIIKGKSQEALTIGAAALAMEAESSAMMFRQCVSVHRKELLHLLQAIFS